MGDNLGLGELLLLLDAPCAGGSPTAGAAGGSAGTAAGSAKRTVFIDERANGVCQFLSLEVVDLVDPGRVANIANLGIEFVDQLLYQVEFSRIRGLDDDLLGSVVGDQASRFTCESTAAAERTAVGSSSGSALWSGW